MSNKGCNYYNTAVMTPFKKIKQELWIPDVTFLKLQ